MSDSAKKKPQTTRRDFIKKGSSLLVAGGVAAGSLSIARGAHSFGSDTIKIGLVGCGGRGTGASVQALNTTGGEVKIVAMGDVFADRLQGAIRSIKGKHPSKFDVPKDRQFVGFDAYKNVLATDIDLVILATPPGFRPLHFETAVKAGKHVFMEKPVATDAPGIRRVLAANEEAKKRGLAVAVGLQRHHETRYEETIKRLHDGAIGDIILARAYWNGRTPWFKTRQSGQTELEYQMRNWYYFNWICGDHIVEQHIHNLDVINWVMQGYPVEANGMGGCEVRKGPDYGETFDHHFVEFTYGNGGKMYSQCRHIPNCWNNVSEYVHGTKGSADVSGKIYDAKGEMVWNFGGGGAGGHQEEHHDLFALLRKGETPNEGEYGALSTMTAIYGRMATYCGKKLSWDEALNSDVALADFDALQSLDDDAPVKQDDTPFNPANRDKYKRPVPGVTKVV
jgi:myo-inositol 2-dehydrogenase/D-chiro-inositol 1-dehydrogenase